MTSSDYSPGKLRDETPTGAFRILPGLNTIDSDGGAFGEQRKQNTPAGPSVSTK